MKKTISTILLSAASVLCADASTFTPVFGRDSDFRNAKPSFEDASSSKLGFYYVRFVTAESMNSILPGLGVGYRRLAGDGAADISVSGIGIAEKKNGKIFWTVPKASYLYYLQPDQAKSFYIGGGLAWGGLESRQHQSDFIGIIPSIMGGYEFVRKSTVLSFAEFSISQPAIAVHKKGDFPLPIAELTIGIGF